MVKSVLLDTNFIISCVRNKLDFFNEICFLGFNVLIPLEIIKELNNIKESKQKMKDKEIAKLSLKILEENERRFKKIKLNKKNVDKGIMDFAKENKEVVIATLDQEIKNKLKKKNKILILRGKNRLEIVG